MKDLQDLKDNVDQLRRMCADCTVSQTERECGTQKEREHVMLNENADTRMKDERNWVNERKPDERAEDVREEFGRGRLKVEEIMEGHGEMDSEKRTHLEDGGRNKWEAERASNKRVIKENEEAETLLEMTEKDGKTQKEGANVKDKLGQKKVPTAGGNRKNGDMAREKAPEKNMWETDRNKENHNKKGDSKGDREDVLESGKERNMTTNTKKKEETAEGDQHVRLHATKETEKDTRTEEDKRSDGIKMSEDQYEHTNKEQDQHREDRKNKEEKGMKMEQNKDKTKATERILESGKERNMSTNINKKEKTAEGDQHVRLHSRKETEKDTRTEEDKRSDGIKMSEDQYEHTNKEREQHQEDTEKKEEKGMKMEQNKDKTKEAERILECGKERNMTTDIKKKEKTAEGDQHVRLHSRKETEKDTRTEEDKRSDGIKMSEDQYEHTNKEREQHQEDTEKKEEKGMKMEQNKDKTKATERILESGKERNMSTNINKKEKTAEGDQHVRLHSRKETEKDTRTEEDKRSDGIKMSEDQYEHTNKEREQHQEDTEKKEEKGMKMEQNKDKTKEAERIGQTDEEKTINREEGGEWGEGDGATGADIKTEEEKVVQSVQRDTDGELASNKASESTDFISDNQIPPSTVGFITTRHKTLDPNKATLTLSSPPPPLSSPHLVTDVDEAMMTGAHGLPSHSTDTDVAHSHQHPYPDADAGFKTTSGPTTTPTIGTLGVPRQQRTSATTRFTSTTSPSVRTRFQGRTGGKPRPAQGPNPAEKHKHGIKPEAIHKLKNPKNDHKQDRAPLPDKTDQKLKPSLQKPTTDQKLKPVKGQQAHNPKPEQRVTLNHLTTDQNLKNNPMLKHDKDLTTDKKPKYHQKSVPPVQRPTSYQRLATVYATGSDTNPQTEPNSKPERNQNNPLLTVKPDPKQKPQKNVKGKEKTKPDLRADYTTVQQPDSGSIGKAKLTLKPNNRSTTELMRNSRDNPSPESDSNQVKTPGQKLALDGINTPSDQKPKPSQKIPAINRDPKPGHIPKLNQKRLEIDPSKSTKPNVKPKTSQAPQKNQGLKTPGPSQTPDLYPKSVPDQIPKAQSNKTSKPRPPPRRGHTFKPGATSVQRPQPAVQQKSNPNTKTDSNPEISGTTADGIQNSQINMPPTSGSVKQSTEMTHSPGDAEFSPSTKESITPSPKTFNSLDTFPLLHALAEGSTVNPNSRAASDLGPQTAGQHSSIPMTTRPNKMIHGTLPSVIPSTSPGSTTLKSITEPALQAELPHHVAETAPEQTLHADNVLVPVPSPRAETTITLSPDTRSTTADTAGPKVPALESSTPSARELRVKINQVAAFSRDSQTSDAWSVDKRPTTEHPEDRGTDLKVKWIPSKVSTALRRDCSDHLLQGGTKSGVYLVTPDIRSKSFSVFCDMELGGGGWTLVQLRQDGSVSFNRTWAEYRSGFGEVGGREFWLGNNMIHLLTRDRDMVLRVELEDFEGLMEYAEYEQFKVASERLRYRLTVGGYSGTAGNALRFSKMYDHNSRAFTTPDRDNDRYPSGNCGAYYSSGWWFDACMAANLNGRYYVGKYKGIRDGIFWGTWHNISSEYYPTNDRQSFKTVRMMIRPKGFAP
ncbi:hypothetical protein JOB18_034958 [Solea senegalensis]|nr:hypothetical protein JOB18_034958 [Solea senegalensis]KAG7522966.1 hypothetical protein JOB18_034958 [Solea senegalensis]